MKLSQLKPGQRGIVSGIDDSPLKGRLRDLGLTDGTEIVCRFFSPAGDPAAYRFRGSVIAIRKQDAETVQVDNVR